MVRDGGVQRIDSIERHLYLVMNDKINLIN